MDRAVLPYELEDPDFAWLINSYRESHPDCITVEDPTLPTVIIVLNREPEDQTVAQVLAESKESTSSD